MKRTILTLSLAATLGAQTLAAQPADTIARSTEPLFTPRDAIVAAGFVAMTVAMFPVDRALARELQDSTVQAIRFARQQAANLRLIGHPGAYYIGGTMYLVGKLADAERIADLGLHGTEALLVGHVTTVGLKLLFGRARPFVDVDDPSSFVLGRGLEDGRYRAFPSGHSTAAFAAAAAVTSETSRWWPGSVWYVAPVMYGGAALVGLSRMYENKHWASDVVLGAMIGTFAGLKVVRYHHTHPGNRIDRWLLGTTVVPTPDGGVALRVTLRPAS